MGGLRPTVGYWVAVRAGEGLALLAAVGGALAVSHQLEHRLTTSPGPLTGLHSLQAAPSAPSVVFAAGPPAARRQRVTLPAVFSSRPAAAATTPAREAPGAPQRGSLVPTVRIRGRFLPRRPPRLLPPHLPPRRVSSTTRNVSCIAARVCGIGPRAGAHHGDLASPGVDSLRFATEQRSECASNEVADSVIHAARLGSRRQEPQPHRARWRASKPDSPPAAIPAVPTGAQDTSTATDAQATKTTNNGQDTNPPAPQAADLAVPPVAAPASPPASPETAHGNSGNAPRTQR